MKKYIILLFVIFAHSIVLADSARAEVEAKIEYALKCNARFTSISEVQITTLEESKQFKGSFYVAGVYKSVASVSGKKLGFSFGDEFHPQSGSFKCIVDQDLKIRQMKWKVGIARGHVKKSCLGVTQEGF